MMASRVSVWSPLANYLGNGKFRKIRVLEEQGHAGQKHVVH